MVPANFSSVAQMLHSVLWARSLSELFTKYARHAISAPGFATCPPFNMHSHWRWAHVPSLEAASPFCSQQILISAGVIANKYFAKSQSWSWGACCRSAQRDSLSTGCACKSCANLDKGGCFWAKAVALWICCKFKYPGRGQRYCCMRAITSSGQNGFWKAPRNPVTETSTRAPSMKYVCDGSSKVRCSSRSCEFFVLKKSNTTLVLPNAMKSGGMGPKLVGVHPSAGTGNLTPVGKLTDLPKPWLSCVGMDCSQSRSQHRRLKAPCRLATKELISEADKPWASKASTSISFNSANGLRFLSKAIALFLQTRAKALGSNEADISLLPPATSWALCWRNNLLKLRQSCLKGLSVAKSARIWPFKRNRIRYDKLCQQPSMSAALVSASHAMSNGTSLSEFGAKESAPAEISCLTMQAFSKSAA